MAKVRKCGIKNPHSKQTISPKRKSNKKFGGNPNNNNTRFVKILRKFLNSTVNLIRIKDICQPLNIDPEKHRLYKTDWLEEPIEAIAKVDKSLHMNSIKNNDILILRDIDNVKNFNKKDTFKKNVILAHSKRNSEIRNSFNENWKSRRF